MLIDLNCAKHFDIGLPNHYTISWLFEINSQVVLIEEVFNPMAKSNFIMDFMVNPPHLL